MSATQCLNHIWLSKPLSKRKKEKEILQKNLLTRFKWKVSVKEYLKYKVYYKMSLLCRQAVLLYQLPLGFMIVSL